MIVFSPLILKGQTQTTYQDIVEMQGCEDQNGNPICDKIVIQVNTTITNNTAFECGDFDVEVDFSILGGKQCVNFIDRVRWYTSNVDYNPKRKSSVHFSNLGLHTIQLEFMTKRVCSPNIIRSLSYDVITTEDCTGCESAISYCDLVRNPIAVYNDDYTYYWNFDQIPRIEDISFLINEEPFVLHIRQNMNNPGVFNFPYWGRDALQCSFYPGLHELINDMNRLLDLAREGNPEYEDYRGHVTLMDSYGLPTIGGGVDLCKIRIKVVDAGMFFYGFHEIFHHAFDLGNCYIGKEYNLDDPEDEHVDGRFTWDESCYYSGFQLFNDGGLANKKKNDVGLGNELEAVCYPSITNNWLDVYWNNDIDSEFSVSIIDIRGRVIESFKKLKRVSSKKINLLGYQKGIYFVKVNNENTGEYKVVKIIKQ